MFQLSPFSSKTANVETPVATTDLVRVMQSEIIKHFRKPLETIKETNDRNRTEH